MTLTSDLESEVKEIFKAVWTEREGRVVPGPEDLKLGNDAVKLGATVLYADISDSTNLVDAKSVSTNPPCSKGIVSKPTGAQSVVPWVSGGRAHRHRAVPGVWRLRAGEFGASGDRWWTQDRVFFGNNGPRGRPEGKVEGPWVCGHALSFLCSQLKSTKCICDVPPK